jgi:hypothetical protein
MLLTVARQCALSVGLVAIAASPIVGPGVSRVSASRMRAEPANVAGVWSFTVELGVGTGHPAVTLKQDGEKLTGIYEGRYGPAPLEGTIKDKKIEFTVSVTAEGVAVTGAFSGVVEGEGANQTMHGDVEFEEAGEGSWSAVKAPAK